MNMAVFCGLMISSVLAFDASATSGAAPKPPKPGRTSPTLCGYCWEMKELKIAFPVISSPSPTSHLLTPAHFNLSNKGHDVATVKPGRIFIGYSHVDKTLQSEVKKNHVCAGPVIYLEHTEFGSLTKDAGGVVSITDEINGDANHQKLPYTVFGVCDGSLHP